MSESVLIKTEFTDLNLIHRGKVRDLYEVDDKLLMVATDRISAFDVVMGDPIPTRARYSQSCPCSGLIFCAIFCQTI
jgi:phosphoribosylaminoimidazole-succinocarboxamide synthase